MEEKKYILFDKYLNNELTAEEKISFEATLKNDLGFKGEFDIYTEIEQSLASKFENEEKELELRETLTSLGKEFVTESKKEIKGEPKVIPLFRYRKLMVAASIALLIGIFVFGPNNPTYSDFANYPSLELVERSENNPALKTAEEAFNSKNYKTAFAQLTILEENFPEDIEIKLYKGICLVQMNQYSQAKTIFNNINDGSSIFKHTASWYQALSLLKQNKIDECKTILKTIPEDAEEFEQANKLLNKL